MLMHQVRMQSRVAVSLSRHATCSGFPPPLLPHSPCAELLHPAGPLCHLPILLCDPGLKPSRENQWHFKWWASGCCSCSEARSLRGEGGVCLLCSPVSSFSELGDKSGWKTVLQFDDKLSNVQTKMEGGVGGSRRGRRTISSKSDFWKFRFTKDHLPSLEVGLKDNYPFYLKHHQRLSLNHKPTKCH